MLVGYSRVSTQDQNADLQKDALAAAGCGKFFEDVAGGTKQNRTGLTEALEYMREGDTLVVWKLDRLGRSLKQLIEVVNLLQQRGVGFRSLCESIDTTTPGGKLIFHVFGALAEFEREVIRERTQAGLQAARARGRSGGRPRVIDEKKLSAARSLMKDTDHSIDEVCKILGVSRSTLYRNLSHHSEKE